MPVLDGTDVALVVAGTYSPAATGTWFVSKAGNDSDAGSRSFPKLTIGAAIAAAISGDKIILGDGTWSADPIDTTGGGEGPFKALEFVGNGPGRTVVTATVNPVTISSGCALHRMSCVATDATNGQGVIVATGSNNVLLEDCVVTGTEDGLYMGGTVTNLVARRCQFTGTDDAANFGDPRNHVIEDCKFTTTASFAANYDMSAVVIPGTANASIYFRRCNLVATRANTNTGRTDAIQFSGQVTLEFCNLQASASNAGYTGGVACIHELSSASTNRLTIAGVDFRSSSAGSGAVKDIDQSAGITLNNAALLSKLYEQSQA